MSTTKKLHFYKKSSVTNYKLFYHTFSDGKIYHQTLLQLHFSFEQNSIRYQNFLREIQNHSRTPEKELQKKYIHIFSAFRITLKFLKDLRFRILEDDRSFESLAALIKTKIAKPSTKSESE